MKYQAVIFDLFGTLVDKLSLKEQRDVLNQAAAVLSISATDFAQLWFETFDMRGCGRFRSIEENIAYIMAKLGPYPDPDSTRIKLAARIYRDSVAHSMTPRRDSAETLSELKARGCKIGLITGCSPEVPEIFTATPLAAFVDVAVFSCVEGFSKPDSRIYRIAAKKLGVNPEDCLYVGDGDDCELTGALTVNMHPVLIQDPYENPDDVHRINSEAKNWKDTTITSLKQTLKLVE